MTAPHVTNHLRSFVLIVSVLFWGLFVKTLLQELNTPASIAREVLDRPEADTDALPQTFEVHTTSTVLIQTTQIYIDEAGNHISVHQEYHYQN